MASTLERLLGEEERGGRRCSRGGAQAGSPFPLKLVPLGGTAEGGDGQEEVVVEWG